MLTGSLARRRRRRLSYDHFCFSARGLLGVVHFPADACQQRGSWFVVWVLGHQFAAEGFGEEGLHELVDVRLRLGEAGLELVRKVNNCSTRPTISRCLASGGNATGRSLRSAMLIPVVQPP